MSDFIDAVVEFNQQILKIEQRAVACMPEHETEITLKCLIEELDEWTTASTHGDVIAQIDALVDLVYFAFGAMYKIGLTPQQIKDCCMAVHEANMSKKRGVNAKRATGAADAIKPEGWVPPEARISKVLFG